MNVLTTFSMLILFCTFTANAKGTEDPNAYFQEKSWSVDTSPTSYIYAKSVYHGEPVQKPNFLTVEHRCRGQKKRIPMVKSLGYCGIDSVNVIGDKFEVQFSDYNYKDARGYCTSRRKQSFKIPSCIKKARPKKKPKK